MCFQLKPTRAYAAAVIVFLGLIPMTFAFQGWEKVPVQPAMENLVSLIPHPVEPGKLFAASSHDVFKENENHAWENLWHSPSYAGEIRHLMVFRKIPDSVFFLTRDGAFEFNLLTQKGQVLFRGKNVSEKSVLSMAVLPEDTDHLFLATEGGLFESDDHGKNWFRMENFSKREPVVLVRVFDERLFAATRRRLYLSRDLNHFQPVFSLLSGGDEEFLEIEDEFSGEEGEITASVSDFRELLASGGNHLLWLATRKGVFENRKGENTWRPLSSSGLQSSDISFLTYSKKSGALFAGSPSGVYEYIPHQKRWKEIFQGLARREVKALTLIPGENEILAVVTPEGLMRYQILPEEIPPATVWIPSPDRTALFSRLIRLEPPPVKIYKAVMRFANLKNGKIKRWHSASRLAALLPTFSFGKDFSENNNVDIDRGSTSEADKFIFGPSDTDRGWDMDVSWDLGDFIWSSNQTSIDGREKLMVELRHDFLSEATRIYYERRRLQMEMIFSPPPTEQEHFSQLLRLEELTALLDSMTDGWMSQELEKIYEGHPEFSRLWEFQAGKS